MNLPDVDVILAIFNGEKYLNEMLLSIKNQRGVSINLIVTDDGSKDKSISIIMNYLDSFNSVQIIDGPQKGPALNFYSALRFSNSPYLAFADQDDIWDENHLANSILRMQNYEHVPSLTFSAVKEFQDKSRRSKICPKKLPNLQLHSLFAENPARGCTIVMNKKAVSRLVEIQPRYMIMHDWWALLLIFLVGKITYSSSPEVLYRVHEQSATSSSRKLTKRIFRFYSALKWRWEPELQIDSILSYLDVAELDTRKIGDIAFLKLSGIRRLLIILHKKRFRMRIIDEIIIRIILIFRKSPNGI